MPVRLMRRPSDSAKLELRRGKLSISFLRAKFFYAVTQIPLEDEYEYILVNFIAKVTEATDLTNLQLHLASGSSSMAPSALSLEPKCLRT